MCCTLRAVVGKSRPLTFNQARITAQGDSQRCNSEVASSSESPGGTTSDDTCYFTLHSDGGGLSVTPPFLREVMHLRD